MGEGVRKDLSQEVTLELRSGGGGGSSHANRGPRIADTKARSGNSLGCVSIVAVVNLPLFFWGRREECLTGEHHEIKMEEVMSVL